MNAGTCTPSHLCTVEGETLPELQIEFSDSCCVVVTGLSVHLAEVPIPDLHIL